MQCILFNSTKPNSSFLFFRNRVLDLKKEKNVFVALHIVMPLQTEKNGFDLQFRNSFMRWIETLKKSVIVFYGSKYIFPLTQLICVRSVNFGSDFRSFYMLWCHKTLKNVYKTDSSSNKFALSRSNVSNLIIVYASQRIDQQIGYGLWAMAFKKLSKTSETFVNRFSPKRNHTTN